MLGDLNAKMKGNVFKTSANDSLYEISKHFQSKNPSVESTMLPQCNIHKFASASPDGETHNQIDHIVIGR